MDNADFMRNVEEIRLDVFRKLFNPVKGKKMRWSPKAITSAMSTL